MALFKCTRCRSSKLAEFYEVKKTTGIQYKTCNQCRSIKLKCGECDKVYGSISDRKRHIIVKHPEIKLTRCTKCNYDCPYDSDMETHMIRAHNKIKNKNKTHECDRCNYKCSTNSTLKTHIKQVHDNIKDIECDRCNYKCSTRSDLKKHIKQVHDKIKDFECDGCNYKCSTKSNLKKHIKQVHDKIKDFKCDRCNYKCSANGVLKQHIKRCTGNTNMSSGEYKVSQTLDEMGIQYKREVSIDLGTSRRLRWDFVINHHSKDYFIEYDGRQHYTPVRFGRMSWKKAKENFNTTQTHDKLKNDYCKDNGLILLRIKYTDYGNIPNILTAFAIKHFDWDGDTK